MEQINYEKLLPDMPTADVVQFALAQQALGQHYLIYCDGWVYDPLTERKHREANVVCSACHETFFMEKIQAGGCSGYSPAPFGWYNARTKKAVISGDTTLCPRCGAEAEVRHRSFMFPYRGMKIVDAWVAELIRVPVEGKQDRLALLDWLVRQRVDVQGQVRYEVWPYTAWVVEERKIVRLMGYSKYMSRVSLCGHWEQRKQYRDDFGEVKLMLPWNDTVLEGTTAEHCRLDLYQAAGGKELVSYLALWRKHPNVENLLVQGCGALVAEWIKSEESGGVPQLWCVNWKEQRPARMLGLNREEFRWLRRMEWSTEDLARYQAVRGAGLSVRLPEDMALLRMVPDYTLNKILDEAPVSDCWRILRYLKKQNSTWSYLQDYWGMARRLGHDVTDGAVRWPKDLKRAHDRVMKEQKHKEDLALREKFDARWKDLEPLSYCSGGLLIRPCRSQKELIAEGDKLGHCVATYANRHANGGTAIFFIRRADAPDTPYYTLEYDEQGQTVRQNRGKGNCDRTPEVKAFEQEWLAWVKAQKTKKRRKTA